MFVFSCQAIEFAWVHSINANACFWALILLKNRMGKGYIEHIFICPRGGNQAQAKLNSDERDQTDEYLENECDCCGHQLQAD
jgi:hypothetical protein